MEEKAKCQLCGKEKPRRRGKYCHDCSFEGYRRDNRETMASRTREQYYAKKEIKAKQVKEWIDKNRPRVNASNVAYAKRNRDKMNARQAVQRAIRSGKMQKLPCAVCGCLGVEAHHHKGYEGENRLDVVFLCTKHHGENHRPAQITNEL